MQRLPNCVVVTHADSLLRPLPPLQDLPRTFPRHAWFHSAEGQEALRQVLTAYAASNPGVGYCQVRVAAGQALGR
jgi:hypothetical protein